jgi:hypothetical protein
MPDSGRIGPGTAMSADAAKVAFAAATAVYYPGTTNLKDWVYSIAILETATGKLLQKIDEIHWLMLFRPLQIKLLHFM